jgi:glyoxylase-like metal-dependent hydrolase (beta-lactamase superfamily II)
MDNNPKPLHPGKERLRLPASQWPRQNSPIPSELKISRVYQMETINETCWAYMKLLRETNKTKKIYPVNPYVEVYRFRENLYGLLTESADGMGDVWMYLTIGPEKAFLVDTGFGIGDLKGLCNEITGGMPLIVVNTHCHYDHAYGNCQFDKVYCHELEAPAIEKQDGHIWDYLFEEGTGRGIWAEFDRNDIVLFKKYEIVPCPDAYIFNLGGGCEIELVYMGGHSAGHAGYLDKKNRVFFAGDDIISMRTGCITKHTEYRDNIGRLAARTAEFDHVFSAHFVTDLESSVVHNFHKTLCEIADDPERYIYMRENFRGKTYFRYVDGLGIHGYKIPVE